MPAPYTGRCFCGSAQYRIAEEPLVRPRYETQPKDFNELLEIGRRP